MEPIKEYDKNKNLIYSKYSSGNEYYYKYDENNNLIHYKNSFGYENWYKYDKDKRIEITQQEFYKLKEQEFLNRKYCSRFEIMDM